MDLHLLFPAPRRALEMVSLLGWLGAFCEASPGRVTHPRPAVRPGNGDGERKANPHPKSHPERTLPPSQKWEALGPRPDPLMHPHPLLRLPSRASPRELSHSGTSPFQVNSETLGTLQALPFPRRLHHAHGREEPFLLVRHTGRAAHSV